MLKLSTRLLRPVAVYRYLGITLQIGRGSRPGDRLLRHGIEDLIIEEGESGTNAEQLEHYDSRDGSGSERSGFEGDQNELEQWKAENEVEIDSKLLGAVPLPFTEFIELSEMISDNIFRLVQKSGYEKPTPIQSIGIPIGLKGMNIVGISRTGSGKTLSFLIPAIDHIMAKRQTESSKFENSPTAIVVLPTRELCQQVQQVASSYLRPLGLNSVALYGGTSKNSQRRELQDGVDMVVATPGRLLDMMGRRRGGTPYLSLESTTFVTLDEADRMLDMGFESDVREIINSANRERQMLLYSATWPQEIRRLATDFLGSEFVKINVGSSKLSANENIIQNVRIVYGREKYGKLKELINILNEIFATSKNTKTLIFANTKRECDFLSAGLRKSGVQAEAIHGGIDQSRRDNIYKRFKTTPNSMLVATDVAARGLDVTDINFVINYDFPQQDIENYVHRIGRTCRGSNQTGTAYTILTPEDSHIPLLIEFIEGAGQEVSPELRDLASGYRGHSRGYGGHRQGNQSRGRHSYRY